MALIGIIFCAASGGAGVPTPGTDEVLCFNTDTYPTTKGGFTFGWEDTISGGVNRANVSEGIDRRLCGINFYNNSNTTTADFRLDLPNTGTWEVGAASGDADFAISNDDIAFQDDTTAVSGTGISSGSTGSSTNFFDITGTLIARSSFFTDWTTVQHTFSSTIFRATLGQAANLSSITSICHLFASEVAAGGALSGSSAATSGATGTLTGNGALSGTSAATSGATGTIANGSAASGEVSGISAATSGATATLTAIGALIGSSAIVSNATGTLIDAIGHLSGAVDATSGATGTLRDGNPNNIWQAVSAASGTWTPTSNASGTWTPV